ncbi:MAG: internal scaffolding protein [Arizlama microvirus]|nr:MAG: internal scaffolding protein [Arizlama microvirus]
MSQKSTTHPNPYKNERTKTVPASETDVNKIVARFEKTGQLPPPTRAGQFLDVTQATDFRQLVENMPQYRKTLLAAEKAYKEKLMAIEKAKQTPVPKAEPRKEEKT